MRRDSTAGSPIAPVEAEAEGSTASERTQGA